MEPLVLQLKVLTAAHPVLELWMITIAQLGDDENAALVFKAEG